LSKCLPAPQTADIDETLEHFRVGPIPDLSACSKLKQSLLDHLVGERERLVRDRQAERLRGLEVDEKIELCRLHHWQIGGFGPLQIASDVDAGLTVSNADVGGIALQAAIAPRSEVVARASQVGGAAAWPLVARAQQRERVRRIGVFTSGAAGAPEYKARDAAFLQALAGLGWFVGRNVQTDYRWGADDVERYRTLAQELVALAPVLAQNYADGKWMGASGNIPVFFKRLDAHSDGADRQPLGRQ
jgi:hypothetical protein